MSVCVCVCVCRLCVCVCVCDCGTRAGRARLQTHAPPLSTTPFTRLEGRKTRSLCSLFIITTHRSVVPAALLLLAAVVVVVVMLKVGGVPVQENVAVVVEPVEDPEPVD